MKDPIRVTSLTRIWKTIRRYLSKTEWAVWLLGLSRREQSSTDPGLILVQIDGLSKTQLERAISDGRMPFLKSLIEKQNYVNHTLYSGLPSSTPSVQGELYYGVRTAVPAFGFRDHRSGQLVRMFASDIANDVESQLKKTGPGLLEGGSSYGNVYSGGAKDVYFCATSFGWSEFLETINPLQIMLVLILNFVMFVRIAGLMTLEFFLATFDFFRGIASGRKFWQELIMIPARVVVVILLRELVTIGACFDSARGQPIIHLNLFGYDEQAHRRGPSSRFAHWTLRGIDNSIKRIWGSAHRGAGREYDVWVFSDHGQETTCPYQLAHPTPIQQVVAKMIDDCCPPSAVSPKTSPSRLPTRASWLGIGWLVSMLFGEQDHDIQTRSPHVQTVTSGPVGFVYLLNDEMKKRRHEFARRLVDEFHVPMTFVSNQQDDLVTVFTPKGTFVLPSQVEQVFGAEFPFLADIGEDILRLVQHPDSGDIVMVGWSGKSESTSFVLQNGAHAGPGSEETRAFVLLPPDIAVADQDKNYLRPNDMRLAALRFLGRDKTPRHNKPATAQTQSTEYVQGSDERDPDASPDTETIRALTYNVHACVGMDGQLSPERIARVIAQSGAHIICLQELDVFRRRSGNRDQAHMIAKYLEMNHKFHPAWHLEEERFGNAILTLLPMRVVRADGLHHHKADRSRRSALWAEIQIDNDISLQVINTHLSIYPREQLIQAQELMEKWIQPASQLGPVVLCGDFNARPNSKTCNAFKKSLFNVESFDDHPTRSTYFSPYPVSRVDHVFVTDNLKAFNTQVIGTRLAKIASDHLPLSVELRIMRNSTDVPSDKKSIEE